MLTSTASSISTHQCWVYRNSFLRHSYKISFLTEFFKRGTEQKARLASGTHVWAWAYLNSSRGMKQGFVHLGYLCENGFIQSHCLLLLEPNIQKERILETSSSGDFDVCLGGWCVWILNSVGCFFILHTVFPPASYPFSPIVWSLGHQHQYHEGKLLQMHILRPSY